MCNVASAEQLKLVAEIFNFAFQNTNDTAGSLYTTHNNKSPECYVTFSDIKKMAVNPATTHKHQTKMIVPTNASAKTKEAIEEHDNMTLCWVDIDSGDRLLDELKNLADQHDIDDYVMYSTASACRDKKGELQGRRWRIILTITPVLCEVWLIYQEALARIFGGGSEAVRIQQGLYAPTNPDGGYYEYHVNEGTALQADSLPPSLLNIMRTIWNEHDEIKVQTENAKKNREIVVQSGGNDIISLVNDTYPLSDVMLGYGYKQVGHRWIHPESQSGTPGVVLLKNENGELRYYSHHENDPLADKHIHDAFDLLCHFEFGGDIQAAVAYFAMELDPDGQKERQREYAIAKAQEETLESFRNLPSQENSLVAESPTEDVHDVADPVVNWPHLSATGGAKNTLPNFKHMLDHFRITPRYNVIRKETEVIYAGKNCSIDNEKSTVLTDMCSLAALNGMSQTRVGDYLLNISDRNPHNPVMTSITSKVWDGISRISQLVETLKVPPYFNRDLLAVLIRKFLISAVAAAAMPSGFHSRGVLVLQGPQGIGKTSWLRRILPPEIRDLFKEGALLDPKDKDTILSAISHWIVELGELDATFRKADIARLKSFITQSEDKIRKPYGRSDETYSRRTVFCGSVNEDTFLVDSTGNSRCNSRFWVVPVEGLDYQHKIDMQQVLAEVYHLYKGEETWWLTPEEEKLLEQSNLNHQQIDAIEEMLTTKYADATNISTMKWMTATAVLQQLNIPVPTNAQSQKAGKVLVKLGFKSKRSNGRKLYLVPTISTFYG